MSKNKRYIILLLLSVFTFAVNADSYYERRVSLFELLPIDSNDIVFLGNSITDGGEFSELLDMPNVKNRGINSDVIDGVRKRLPQILKGNPAKIFLLIGINDISHNLSAVQVAKNYELLVREIRKESPQTQLYIQSVMPINNDFGRYKTLAGKENTILELNELLLVIAKQNGAIYVDLAPALSDVESGKLKKEYTNDGLHLMGEGYRAWINTIKRYILE